MKMLFCRIGWMQLYEGLKSEKISAGGAYVDYTGIGHEAFNFKNYKGFVYGYCRPSASVDYYEASININRLGACKGDESIDRVNVVWFAKHPLGGQVIVGFYKEASVYRHFQYPPRGSKRNISGDNLITGFYVKARAINAILIDPRKRNFTFPRGKGWPGQSNVWFCDLDNNSQKQFLKKVARYIN